MFAGRNCLAQTSFLAAGAEFLRTTSVNPSNRNRTSFWFSISMVMANNAGPDVNSAASTLTTPGLVNVALMYLSAGGFVTSAWS